MKKRTFAARALAATGLLFAAFTAQAQQADSLQGKQLNEVLVTATRTEKDAADVGRSITVLTAADLKNTVYHSVGDLLAQQAGIYLAGAGQNPGMTQSIFLRGANSNQTAILVDGIRITDPSGVNNALDLSELSLASIDRIEIVRGSHSTLYGSSAIGGVVNIITKGKSEPGLHPDAELQFGRFGKGTGLLGQKLGLNYTFKNGFYANGEVQNQKVNGIDATVDTVTSPDTYNKRDQDNYKRIDLAGKIGYQTDRLDAYASYKNTNTSADFDQSAYVDDDNAVVDFERHLFTYGASYKFTPIVLLKYVGGYSRMFRETENDSSAIDAAGTSNHTYSSGNSRGSTATNELQVNFSLPHLQAVVGVGRYRETMNAQNYYYSESMYGVYESVSDLDTLDLGTTTTNIFAHLDLNGTLLNEHLSNFSLALGGRFNRHSKFGNYTTVEVNPTYKLRKSTLLYAVYATGFNAPSLYQLYAPDENAASGITTGNAELGPETSASFEIGLKQMLGKFRLGLAYFYTQVDNTIEYVYLWSPGKSTDALTFVDYQGATYLNLSRQVSRGLELDFASQLSTRLKVSGNFNLVNGQLKVKQSDVEVAQTKGNQVQLYNNGAFINKEIAVQGLTRRPNTANLHLTYTPCTKLALQTDVRYTGSRLDIYYDAGLGPYGSLGTEGLADYTLLGFTARLQFTPALSAALRIENALNKSYQEINGFRSRGRGVYLSLKYSY